MKLHVKFILILSMGLFLFNACQLFVKEPELRSLKNVQVHSASKSKVNISADLEFFNPNSFSIDINSAQIEVKINNIDVGEISQVEKIKILKKSNFKLPILINFNPREIFKDQPELVIKLYSSFVVFKKIELSYTGHVHFDIKGVNISVPINFSEDIAL